MALSCFAGGSVLDISLVYGVSYVEVYESIWRVVDAINHTECLDIKFPVSHLEQVNQILFFGLLSCVKLTFYLQA